MEFNDKEPIYLQIAGVVCEHILAGKWKPGERIPSVRDLAVDMEVNPNTIMRTYEVLQEMEVVTNRRGYGLYVAEDGLKKVINWKKENFVREALPEFLKAVFLLGISMDEIRKQYDQYAARQLREQKRTSHENK